MKKKARKPARSRTRKAAAKGAATTLRETWDATLASLSSAEAAVEKEVKTLLRKNKIRVEDASELLASVEKRFVRERKRALKQIEGRLSTLQTRVRKERKHLTKLANDAVQGALSSFNIPSRREVAELTRKVDELSRKIDTLRRRKR
jgi:polyhydroxyalkanoate synthesis regulator phasin